MGTNPKSSIVHEEGPDRSGQPDDLLSHRLRAPYVNAAARFVGDSHCGAPPCVRKRVLVVDDNCDAADTLALMVEMLGHDVRRLYDPHEVVAEVARFRPELLFLDVGMPGLSGYDLACTLRKTDGGKEITIVAVTGWGQPEDRRMTRAAGFDEHLIKPPAFDAIQRLCNTLLLPACR